jgi:FkbM family methyltransferase
MKRFGTVYGGFFLPSNLNGLDKNSVIYCAGVGEDISFDIEIAKKTGANIYLFDPTPRAIEHVNQTKQSFSNNIKPKYETKHGGGDKNYWNILFNNKIPSNKIFMYDFGIFTENKTLKFYKPKNPNYVSHSLVTMLNVKLNDYLEVPVKNLKTIMNELGHNRIDLLKLDIEGVENEVLNQMLDEKIYPKYLCVDFDGRRSNRNIPQFNLLIQKLKKLNYKIIKNNNYDISFQLITS